MIKIPKGWHGDSKHHAAAARGKRPHAGRLKSSKSGGGNLGLFKKKKKLESGVTPPTKYAKLEKEWGMSPGQMEVTYKDGTESLGDFITKSKRLGYDTTSIEGWKDEELEIQNEDGEGAYAPNLEFKGQRKRGLFSGEKGKNLGPSNWSFETPWLKQKYGTK